MFTTHIKEIFCINLYLIGIDGQWVGWRSFRRIYNVIQQTTNIKCSIKITSNIKRCKKKTIVVDNYH